MGTYVNSFAPLAETSLPASKKKRHKRAYTALEDSFPTLPTKPDNEKDMPKFITIQSTDPKKTLQDYNVFLLKKSVDTISTKYTKSSFLKNGSLLLLCENHQIAEKFCKATKLAQIPIKAELNHKLNACKGTVYSRSLVKLTNEEIVEGLSDYGVTEVYKMTRMSEGTPIPTGLVILTFDRYAPPKEILVGFEKVEVRDYIPNPMRCKRCQVLGHTKNYCKAEEEICETCALAKPHDTCTRQACVNCATVSHPSNSRNCPKFLLQREFLRIKTQNHCTLYEAKKMYYKLNPNANNPQPSYAQSVKSQQQQQTTQTITTNLPTAKQIQQIQTQPILTTQKPPNRNTDAHIHIADNTQSPPQKETTPQTQATPQTQQTIDTPQQTNTVNKPNSNEKSQTTKTFSTNATGNKHKQPQTTKKSKQTENPLTESKPINRILQTQEQKQQQKQETKLQLTPNSQESVKQSLVDNLIELRPDGSLAASGSSLQLRQPENQPTKNELQIRTEQIIDFEDDTIPVIPLNDSSDEEEGGMDCD